MSDSGSSNEGRNEIRNAIRNPSRTRRRNSNAATNVSRVFENENTTAKPTLNESMLNRTVRRNMTLAPDFFFTSRTPLKSKTIGNPPFFTNAKPAEMLERGWIRSEERELPKGTKGLYVEKDGHEIEVTVVRDLHRTFDGGNLYTFVDSSGNVYQPTIHDRLERWDFYLPTKPKPFVPRVGGKKGLKRSRKIRTRKNRSSK